MRCRSLLLGLVLAAAPAHAQPVLHVTAAPAHARTLLAALGELPSTVDVAVTRIDVTPDAHGLAVRVELRAVVSDESGKILYSSAVHATAKGSRRERVQIEQDAIDAAAHELAKQVRARASVAGSWSRSST
ncbi:MAG TPA: hypothetical protein VLT45_24710 [Kofleriaceae bacterium]|nr:hypothetical protein [Kofleriaceae bacterium]